MPQPDQTPAGVIHDIGFRPYTGIRQGRTEISRSLYVYSLRSVYGLGRAARSKILPFGLATVMVLPALIMAVITVTGANQGLLSEPILPYSRYQIVLQAAIAIFVATQAPQTVSLDLRFNTLPLYMSRPLERIDYVRAKYAAFVTALFIFIAAPLLVLYLGALAAGFDTGRQTADVAGALAGAALSALLFSGVGLVIASMTVRRGFGVAAIITVLVLSYTIVSSLQGMIGHGAGDLEAAGWVGLFSVPTLVDGIQVWGFGAESSTPAGPVGNAAGVVFVLVSFAAIAACDLALRRRYRKVRL